jgi:hypothetical protein
LSEYHSYNFILSIACSNIEFYDKKGWTYFRKYITYAKGAIVGEKEGQFSMRMKNKI